jgi:hypothetical protein
MVGRDYLWALDNNDKLVRIEQPISEGVAIHPPVNSRLAGYPKETAFPP